MPFYIFDIEWDSEGMDPQSDCGLPANTFVEVANDTTVQNLYEAVGMRLHDIHGFKPIRYKIQLSFH